MVIASPSRAKRRKGGVSTPPIARQVPRLIQTGRPKRRPRLKAQPTWSPCSWVTNTASSSSGASPARASRVRSSRSEKPQSTSTRLQVLPLRASTTVALPLLPLPRLQKRIIAGGPRRTGGATGLLEVFDQQADDALACLAVLGLALAVEHGHRAALAFALDLHAIARRPACFVLLAAEAEDPAQQARLVLAGLGRIDIANEVQALRAVAVLDREAAAV